MLSSFASIAFSNASRVQCVGPGLMKISVDAHQTIDQPVALVPRLEVANVLPQRLGQLALALAGLDVLALEPLHVGLVEHGRHRLDGLEELGDRLEMLVPVEHAGMHRGGVGVVGDRIPGAEDDVIEGGERDEVLDQRRAPLGALAQPDRRPSA